MTDNVTIEDLRKNYSPIGTELIERLYGSDFLSLSGRESADVLVDKAGVMAASRVLDVGSGVGGAALHLAEQTGCELVGVDLMEWNVELAGERAAARGLDDRVSFAVGDAKQLDFADGSFDIVWSQDAWCHVPGKRDVVAEAVRVLRPGGSVALTDWVALTELDDPTMEEIGDAVSAPDLAMPEQYERWFAAEGLDVIHSDDISTHFRDRYRDMMATLAGMEEELSNEFSPRVFEIMMSKNGRLLEAFENGEVGGHSLVARRS